MSLNNTSQFLKNRGIAKNIWRTIYKCNSLHLVKKYAWIFVLGHYLFFKACSWKTVLFLEQIMSVDKIISKHISVPNGGYCLPIKSLSWHGYNQNTLNFSAKCLFTDLHLLSWNQGHHINFSKLKQGVKLTFFPVATWLLNILKW